jgi:hypothetical protein
MKYIKSTAEILAFKALNRNIDKTWVNWAVDMLIAGYETENLIILAGEIEPYDQFELQKLTSKILEELNLDFLDQKQVLKNCAYHLIKNSLNNEIEPLAVLKILKDICVELDYEENLYDFYLLYFAKVDLLESVNQWYWKGATQANIDSTIKEYFINYHDNFIE